MRASLPAARPVSPRPSLDGRGASGGGPARLLALTLALVSTAALSDFLLGDSVVLIGLYIVGPLIAASTVDARRTAVVSGYALALAALLGHTDGIFGSVDFGVRFATVAVASVLAVWTARMRSRTEAARERAERAERRSSVLAEASTLLGSSLDYEATLRAVAGVAVPRLADWCWVSMLEDDGSIRRVALAHTDSAEAIVVREREAHPGDAAVAAAMAQAIGTGTAALVGHLAAPATGSMAGSERNAYPPQGVICSFIVVPLAAHGATLGAVALATADSFRCYDESDLAFARELASRCAIAVDNARRHRDARESEERFRLLVDAVEDYAIFSIDGEGRVASWNAGAQRVNGHEPDEILGRHISAFYTAEDIEAGLPEESLRLTLEEGRYEEEGWRVRRDGGRFYANTVTTALRDEAGLMRGYARVTRDVTERKRLETQLAHQAFHDSMTGLPNRRLFLDRVAGALARAERREGSAAVLFFDLDRFKAVNDTLGHAAGDELLLGAASRLRDAVRLEDTVARFGGDEFAVLCEDLAERGDAITVADRITRSLGAPFEIDGSAATVSASVGLAFATARHTADSLLQDADAAMYAAKERGEGRPVVFDESLRAQSESHSETEGDLRRALERDELRLVYQPLVDLETNEVAGVEALVRWCHPERGLLRPAEFMELAEEPDLAARVGEWVLREACSQLARWSEEAPDSAPLTLSLAVNLSARQLPQPELPELVAKVLAETGVDPATLSLEIAERDLVAHPRSVTALFALRGLGVRLAVDDFGTGYSSLSLLKRLSVDSLKIAAPFVEGLGRRAEDSTLVAAMISMAQSLGVTTVAEAVETRAQLEELRALGCDRAQGYLFARPVAAELLPEALAEIRGRLDARAVAPA